MTSSDELALIPVTVIGGYLGAGKTTLLNSILARSGGRRIGVVVNDFGELGIDAAIVESASGVPVVNLANGCVCCTLGDDLRATLGELAAQRPVLDHIVIEASGIADPAATAAWGTVRPFAPGGIVVLAAANSIRRQVNDRYVGTEVRRQLDAADIVVVTKTDRCEAVDREAVRAWLDSEVAVPVVEAVEGQLPIEIVLDAGVRRAVPGVGRVTVRPEAASSDLHSTATYVTWTGEWSHAVSRERLDAYLRGLPDGVLRLKGFVRVSVASSDDALVLVQVVGRSVSITPTSPEQISNRSTSSRLQVIGVADALAPTELDDVFALHLTAD